MTPDNPLHPKSLAERQLEFWERASLMAIGAVTELAEATLDEASGMAARTADGLLVEWRKRFGVLTAAPPAPPRPTIVCLCGSTRFWKQYQEANRSETRAGRIVLSVGSFVHPETEPSGTLAIQEEVTAEQKAELDQLHLRKIDLADEVLILNVGGYMGDSTRRELEYALQQGKVVRFLEVRRLV